MKRISRSAEAAGAEVARLGDELREARLALGIAIEEMADRLRIRRAHLEALEEGRLGDLPGAAYAVGFVRSYAVALGLDADEMARRFRDLTGPAAVKPRLIFPEPVPDRGMPAGLMIGVGAMVAVGAYVAWFNWSGGGSRTVDIVPPVPPRLEAAAEQGRAQMPMRDAAPSAPLPLAVLPTPGGAGANSSAQAATVPSAPLPPPFQASAPASTPPVAAALAPAQAAAPAAPAAADPAALPDGTRIVLRARPNGVDGAWVQVRDPRSGQVLLNRVLRPGESWPVPPRAGLLLDTGKATELDILLDGQPQPTLEGVIGVRRNISLEPDRLRQRLVPAAAIPAPPPPAPGRG